MTTAPVAAMTAPVAAMTTVTAAMTMTAMTTVTAMMTMTAMTAVTAVTAMTGERRHWKQHGSRYRANERELAKHVVLHFPFCARSASSP
jgi:uncharacterized membrane protein YhhN